MGAYMVSFIFVLSVILITQTSFVFAKPNLDCDSTLQTVLGLNKLGQLPARTLVVEAEQILKEVELAELDLKNMKEKLGSAPKPDDNLAFTNYQNTLSPYYNRIHNVRSPLLAANIFKITSGTDREAVKSKFDRIEEYGSPVMIRLFVKKNKINGIQILSDNNRKTYVLNESCKAEIVTSGFESKKQLGLQYQINSKVCGKSKNLSAQLDKLPEITRNYEDACKVVDGILIKTSNGGHFCACASNQKISINPWAHNCGRIRPEVDARDLIESEGGFVWDGLKPQVRQIIDLCAKDSALLSRGDTKLNLPTNDSSVKYNR